MLSVDGGGGGGDVSSLVVVGSVGFSVVSGAWVVVSGAAVVVSGAFVVAGGAAVVVSGAALVSSCFDEGDDSGAEVTVSASVSVVTSTDVTVEPPLVVALSF